MRLINKSSSPKYCRLANSTVKPGCSTRELDFLSKFLQDMEENTNGFEKILSDKDIHLLMGIFAKCLSPSSGDDSGVEELVKTLNDPDGIKAIDKRARERRAAIQKARAEALKEFNDKEARIRSESNIIGPDGNPIPKEAIVAAGKGEDIKPELHPEMHNDLKSLIENNLAVMTTASGKPIRNPDDSKTEGAKTVMARPGGTPVSHNPKDYQKPRSVAPGQPDYFND